MIKNKLNTFIISILLPLVMFSCVGGTEGEDAVSINKNNLTTPLVIELPDNNNNLGEYLNGTSTIFYLTLRNNSAGTISGITFKQLDLTVSAFEYEPDEAGEGSYPGDSGDCGIEMPAGSSCRIALKFAPPGSGEYEQTFRVDYQNLLESQSTQVTLSAISGTPASLFFPDEISSVDFGIVEQTVATAREAVFTINNSGGIRARNLTLTLTQSTADNPPAFEISEHNCPTELLGGISCQVRVSFTPRNNDEADPETQYAAQLTFTYERDSEGTLATLNSYMSALSTTIEAKLKTSISTHQFNNSLVMGNSQDLTVKITNDGFQGGILKSIIFTTEDDNSFYNYNIGDATLEDRIEHTDGTVTRAWAECQPPIVDGFLTCTNPEIGALSGLDQFPFKIEDRSNCFATGKIVAGKTLTLPGESCEFRLTYQPTSNISLNATHPSNINGTNIDVKYDSRFKDNETIRFTPLDGGNGLFTISGGRTLPGSLGHVNTNYGSSNDTGLNPELVRTQVSLDPVHENRVNLVDFGRIALITGPSYGQEVTITFANPNTTLTTITGVVDGQGNAIGHQSSAGWPQDLNDYYRNLSHNCSLLTQGATCTITFNLTPIAQANPSDENALMYDVDNGIGDQYKSFRISYRGGRNFDDDGNPLADRFVEVRLTARLIRKGFLVYDAIPVNHGDLGSKVSGFKYQHQVLISNVGTGTVSYIAANRPAPATTPSPNHNPNNLPVMPNNNAAIYPYSIVSAAPDAANSLPSGRTYPAGTRDCLDDGTGKAYVDIANLGRGDASLTGLPQGQSCTLTIEYEIENRERMAPSSRYTWNFNPERNTADELLNYAEYTGGGDSIYFTYYDGDGNPSADDVTFGDEYTLADYDFSITFRTKPGIRLYYPQPLAGAVVWYPSFNVPALMEDGAEVFPALSRGEILQRDSRNGATASTNYISQAEYSMTHFTNTYRDTLQADVDADNELIEAVIYLGAFPVTGETYDARIRSLKFHYITPIITEAKLRNAGGPFALTTPITPPSTASAHNRWHQFTYTPTSAGIDENYYDITIRNLFDNEFKFRIKLIAEAYEDTDPDPVATSYPNVALSWQEYDDINDTILDPTVNNVSLATGSNVGGDMAFTAVKGSSNAAEKLITITNTSSAVVRDLNIFIRRGLLGDMIAENSSPAGYFLENNTCIGVDLNPGETCSYRIEFAAPLNAGPTVTRYGGMSYQIDTNRYIHKNFRILLNAKSPAVLVVDSVPRQSVFDSNRSITYGKSYLMQLGEFNDPSKIVFSAPGIVKTLGPYTLTNESDLKASFLSVATPAPGAPWTDIFDDGLKRVDASRECFYGDDEFDGAIPLSEKGFDDTPASPCQIRFHYVADGTYLGRDILTDNEVIHIPYWNAFRQTTDELDLHLRGFIEPDTSTAADTIYSGVTADDTGKIAFTWPTITADNTAVGNITGYRVFFSQSVSDINGNVYENENGFEDIDDPSQLNHELFGQVQGSKLYIRIMAKRLYNGETYVSDIANLPILSVVIPPNNVIYDYEENILVDRFLTAGIGNKAETIARCGSKFYSILEGGSPSTLSKQVMNLYILNFLLEDATRSEYYMGAVSHWLADDPVDIVPIFTPYDYDPTNLFDYIASEKLLYQKTCETNSCTSLSRVYGGDGDDLPTEANLYIDGNNFGASARCWAPAP